jgi:hypothetical protein
VVKPFAVGETGYAEIGASFYGGTYYSTTAARGFDDNLWGAHAYLGPDPLGFQAQYYTGETEGDDIEGWTAMGLWRPSAEGLFFVRYDEYDGPRKGQGLGNRYDRHRTSIGYTHMVDDKTELTVEYDIEDLDTPEGGSNDLLGVQVQVSY